MDRDGGSLSIQDSYLGRARRERAWLTIFLNSGKKITGRIRSFDRYTLVIEDRGSEQMIFKHAIATISTSRTFTNSINFEEQGKGTGTAGRPQDSRARSRAEGTGGHGSGAPPTDDPATGGPG